MSKKPSVPAIGTIAICNVLAEGYLPYVLAEGLTHTIFLQELCLAMQTNKQMCMEMTLKLTTEGMRYHQLLQLLLIRMLSNIVIIVYVYMVC
jgi:hypothetical protein